MSKGQRQNGGRHATPIDWEKFDKLCHLQCSVLEIAAFFDTSEDTIKRAVKREKKMTFQEYAGAKRKIGNISLRRRQFALAEDGNATMLIWLGKNVLGQVDKLETAISNKDGVPFKFTLSLGDRAIVGNAGIALYGDRELETAGEDNE